MKYASGLALLATCAVLSSTLGCVDFSSLRERNKALKITVTNAPLEVGQLRTALLNIVIERPSGNGDPIEVTVDGAPKELVFDPLTLGPGQTTAGLSVQVSSNAAVTEYNLTLRAKSANDDTLAGTATCKLVVYAGKITAVSNASGAAPVARQGFGPLTFVVTGKNLAQVARVSIDDVDATLEIKTDDALTLSADVAHGVPPGGKTLHLAFNNAEVTFANALTVTEITASAGGAGQPGNDTQGDGTPASPYRTATKALGVADRGDTVLLLDGVYDAAGGETWPAANILNASEPTVAWPNMPSGVSLRGASQSGVVLRGAGREALLAPAGNASIANLTLTGFDVGIFADAGRVSITNVKFTDGGDSALFKDGISAWGAAQLTLSGTNLWSGKLHRAITAGGVAQVSMSGGEIGPLVGNDAGVASVESAALNIDGTSIHDSAGPAFSLKSGGTAQLKKCQISKSGVAGGSPHAAIEIETAVAAQITVDGCRLAQNPSAAIAVKAQGGAAGKLTVLNATIESHPADGIYFQGDGALKLRGNRFSGNKNGVYLASSVTSATFDFGQSSDLGGNVFTNQCGDCSGDCTAEATLCSGGGSASVCQNTACLIDARTTGATSSSVPAYGNTCNGAPLRHSQPPSGDLEPLGTSYPTTSAPANNAYCWQAPPGSPTSWSSFAFQ